MFTARFQEWVRAGARRIVPALRLLGFTPNALTLIGLAICAASAVLVATGYLIAGGILLLLASAFDILDGAVARVTGKVYRYGAFLDSTTDRYAESFTYMALTGSLLVSYVRARAQSLGFVCDGGIFARPERVVLTVVGLLVPPLLFACLVTLAVLTNVTAVQRIWFVWRQSLKTAPADT